MDTLNYISHLNNEKNKFLNQEVSQIVKYINMRNNIHDYNYHYALSFWVYFDSSILRSDYTNQYSLIMNYANKPNIVFDNDQKELVVTVDDCECKTCNDTCETIEHYRSKNILYQKWNHFVVNYNYGKLDIFINNNLVTSISE